jgi:hypothetical protein
VPRPMVNRMNHLQLCFEARECGGMYCKSQSNDKVISGQAKALRWPELLRLKGQRSVAHRVRYARLNSPGAEEVQPFINLVGYSLALLA